MTSFTKMHGLGNDFIIFHGDEEMTMEEITRICDRHTGIGADGVLTVSKLGPQKLKMDYWNSDGSEAEMCGNGLRCVARYAVDKKMVKPGEFSVLTPVGELKAEWDGINPNNINVQVGKVTNLNNICTIEGLDFHTATVGNPHAIAFVDKLAPIDETEIGPIVETDSMFPNKTNVEFVKIRDGELHLKIWERGAGHTLACGTGMVSAATVAHDLGLVDLPVKIYVPGGVAHMEVDDEGYARLIGPAAYVFSGEVAL